MSMGDDGWDMDRLTGYGSTKTLETFIRKTCVIIAIGKAIGGLHVWKMLEDGLLHCQLWVLGISDVRYRVADILYRDLCRVWRLAKGGQPWSEKRSLAGNFRKLQLDHGE